MQASPYKNKVTTWYAEHSAPADILLRAPFGEDENFRAYEPIKPDVSNYRRSDSIVRAGDYEKVLMGRSILRSRDIPHNVKYTQPDVSTAAAAGNFIADYQRMHDAMSDWTTFLRGSQYMDSFYDQMDLPGSVYNDWDRRDDARKMALALSESNGDVESAFQKVVDGKYRVSDGAYNALLAMMGYDINPDKNYDARGLETKTVGRFFNGVNAARDNYDIDDSRPSSDAYYGYDQDAYNTYMREQAARDFKYRDGLKYARGGHLRTPKTIRSSNGIKMHRAEGLGGADYDIYF